MTNNCIKLDYLTVSLLKGSSADSVDSAVKKVLFALHLDKLEKDFVLMCSNYRYEAIYRFQNISLKIPSEDNFAKTGICIEMSGSGVDYYENYISIHKKTTLKAAFNRFRLLYLEGYKTKCSRIDVAIDDKCFADEEPVLDLDVIDRVLKSRYFVSKFRRSDPNYESGELTSVFACPPPSTIDDKLPYNTIESMNHSTGRIGKTIYLGKRKSLTSVRIYDKLAEQEAKREKPPADLKHWVRFELEFHRDNASAVFSKFLDSKDDFEFSTYISRVIFNLIRFVDKDRSRLYNCTVCDWWIKFLDCMSDKGMYINKLSTNRYLRTVKYLITLSGLLAGIAECDPKLLDRVIALGKNKPSKSRELVKSDFNAYSSLSPGDMVAALEEVYRTISGEEYWRLFADQTDGDFDERMKNTFEEAAQ